jgi:hypothetical protein
MTELSAFGNSKKFRTDFDRAMDEGLLEKNPFNVLSERNDKSKRAKKLAKEITV